MALKDFNSLSGPWTGWSIQDGIRISESMNLTISEGRISGTGTDMDGDFDLIGFYKSRIEQVMITRVYTRTTEPSQQGVGYPYDYQGQWDGAVVAGAWHPRSNPSYGGPFEMWPDREEDREELAIQLETVELTRSQ